MRVRVRVRGRVMRTPFDRPPRTTTTSRMLLREIRVERGIELMVEFCNITGILLTELTSQENNDPFKKMTLSIQFIWSFITFTDLCRTLQ